ncbi:MAG: primosomal protein N', partial [Actinobacteria bacterium]|nr:primosomal protein N' [Actinomycetota bacterium]
LAAVADGSINLLVGTQMLAKGHDLPGVTLVGVICADQGLRIPDPRCSERCFALLTQVAGRAGRAKRPGRVIFQTFDPDHQAIQAAVNNNAPGFLDDELKRRRDLALPPFHRAVMIRCEHTDPTTAEQTARQLAAIQHQQVDILGPIPAAVERLRGRYRFQVMATSKTAGSLQAWLDEIVPAYELGRRSGVRIAIDVDPSELI